MSKRYRLTEGDKEILKLAKNNPNYFTDYYLRSDMSGTWWLPGAKSEKWKRGYDKLYAEWRSLLRPEKFDFGGNNYKVVWEHENDKKFPEHPAFFHNHGPLFLPYQLDLHVDRHPIRVVIGGFGSAKTFGQILSGVVYGNILDSFRMFFLAPESTQAEEGYTLMMQMIEGTLFQERFLISHRQRPYPRVVFGHEGVGESRIEFFPIANNETKLRTLTGDCAVIDQAEHQSMELRELIRSVGTRFRGRVLRSGRERLGTITFLANSSDNQELWDLYDEAEDDPENYLSLSPHSEDNPYLTDRDIERFKLTVGSTKEDEEVYMEGKRPIGDGDHFSKEIVTAMIEPQLDAAMEAGINYQIKHDVHIGYVHEKAPKIGTVKWLLPYNPDRKYIIISDAGTKNPPFRDSPVIFIWDITDMPGSLEMPSPAYLAGFWWVYGNNKIDNWANAYNEMVFRYHAIGTNGFDATGYQSGYDKWLNALLGLLPEKISLAGNNKALCLNSAKVMTARFMVKTPLAVSALYDQISKYKYPPEPPRLRQDLTMTFIMSCWWMNRLFYVSHGEFEENENVNVTDRNDPILDDRYSVHDR